MGKARIAKNGGEGGGGGSGGSDSSGGSDGSGGSGGSGGKSASYVDGKSRISVGITSQLFCISSMCMCS